MSLSEVSKILWRERQLVDLLMFKLEEEHFVLASERTRWLAHATREVESIIEEIKRVELERAMAVAGSAGELCMPDAPSLREMVAIAPPPWDGIFAAHRSALLLLASKIDAITESNRDLLERGQIAVSEALASRSEIDIDADRAAETTPDRSHGLRLVTSGVGYPQQRSVRSLDVARISQAGSNSDEEMAHMIDVDRAQGLMNLRARETTYQAALAAAAKAIPPSLAAFLQ
jgi:hypothetical protein